MAEQYKIELGVKLRDGAIQDEINDAQRTLKPIEIKVDAETKELTNTIKEALSTLSKGTKDALKLDTSEIKKSLDGLSSIVDKIKQSLGTLDNGDMKSLVVSVNQMAKALGKAENESDSLLKSLAALSKKDLSINIGLDMGKKNNNMIAYGRAARKQVIPELEAQMKELETLLGGQQATMKKLTSQGSKVGFDVFTDFNDFNSDSAIKKMEAMEKYVNSLKKLATLDGIKLDGFNEVHRNATELINDITGVEDAVDKAGDVPDKIKKFFGSGIDVEGLSASLEPIAKDLTEIREAVVNLSKGVSLEGLTQSFDRLSDTIEKLVSNVTLAKTALDDGLSGIASANINPITNVEKTSEATTATVIQNEKKKQEAYKATADAVIYHAGVVSRLNKAETNGRFYGSDRGTGYYGTGHYFVDAATKGELDRSSYSKLPYTSVDISKYDNLFRASTDEIAGKLHDFLKNLTRFTQGSDSYDVSELFTQFKSVFGDTIMDIKEFGSRLEQLKTFMSNSNLSDRSDSVSTQFMKSLGYEGVDTRGTRYADTEYGTVIYDLKEESILQANITDELQKQGQMLEKINYAKGQVFDKDEDNRIQGIIDAQNKLQEIKNEFKNSFDSTGLDKAESDLSAAENRLREIDETIGSVQHSLNNLEQEYKEFSNLMSMVGLDDDDILLWEDEDEWKQNKAEDYQNYIKTLNQEKAELQSKIPILEEVYNRERQLANEAYEQSKRVVEQRHLEAQQAKEAANIVSQNEEKKQRAYRETAAEFNRISKDTSLVRDDGTFKQVFEVSNQAAQEAQRHFQELLADEKAVVSVTEQFDDSNALQSFAVNIKRATGEVETLRYAMKNLAMDGEDDNWIFAYQGSSVSNSNIEKLTEARIKSTNKLQTQLEAIKTGYEDLGATKPIKDADHISALDKQYRKVEKAIDEVRNADNSMSASMISNAEKQKSVLEGMVREYRNAENVATSLRSKDIKTVGATYESNLDVLISKMRKDGVYTSGFESGAENLRSMLSSAVDSKDKAGLVSFLNGLDKLEAGYKRASASVKEFNQAQKVGINVSGLESKIADIQRISPEIDRFEAEIDGAKVSVQSLLNDLKQVKTQGNFSVVNSRFKSFADAAKAAGIAVTETAQKAKSINDIKIKLTDTGFNGFEQEVARAHLEAEKLEGSTVELEAALRRLDTAMAGVYSADKANDTKRLVAANEEYEVALKKVYSQLKLNQQAEKQAYDAEMLSQKKASLSSDMEIWLKENTKAAKDFGEEIRRLQASLDGLDANGVKLAGQQFKNLTKQAQVMGKTGLTVFDKLKSKVKEYAAYISAAEIFMYAEQAFREMFETVKEIDTAMTGLYRVTDLTAAEYDSLFNEMISSAKEYGATLNDIINATTDWVRAGFDANTSLGLAEVTTMYQHISDLDYDTAAENLITAYNGFKDELNGAFNGDTVASVGYIADILNELDKQNCP